MPNSKATAPASVVIGKEGEVFIRTGDGRVHAFDSATSKDKWVFTGGGPCAYLVRSPDGTLFVGSSATNLSALDGATGVEKWRFQSDSAIYTRPALGHNGRLYFGTRDTNLCVVDAAAGQQTAAFQMDDLPRELSTPAIGTDGTVYLGTARSNVCAVDGITGTTRWRRPLGAAPISGPALGADGTVYAAAENFRLHALKGTDGAVRWSRAFQKRVFAPVVAADGTLYVVEDLSGLHALDPATGTNKWSCPRNNIGPGIPILAADGTLYAGSSYRWMVAISAASGQVLWERRFDEPCVGDALALGLDGTVYASGWNYLYALEGTAPLASAPWARAGGDAWNRSAQVVAGVPEFLIRTADQAVPEGGTVMAGVVFSGQGMTYRWFLNDAPLAVELDRSYLALTNFSLAQAGQYRVVASNAFGETASEPIRISLGYTIATHIDGPGEIRLAPALSLYPAGSQVEVQAVSTNGVFRGWSGALTGTNNPAVLTVTTNVELTASFDSAPGQLLWEWRAGGSVAASPTVGPDGTVYLNSTATTMCALNPRSREVLWEYSVGGRIASYAALGDNALLYFGAADKKVHAVDASTGQKQWTYLTGANVSLAPAIGPDGTVYAASADRNLYALDGSTGEVKWQYQTGDGPGCSPIVGVDGTVFLARKTGTAYYVCALDPGTGTERWISSRFGTLRDALMVGADGTVFCASSGNKTVYALAAVSGQILWQSQLGGSIGVGSMVIGGDGTIFAGCSDKKLYALDPASGQTKWTCPSGGGSGGPGPLALATDGTVYVTTDVELIALDGESHQLKWRYQLPSNTGGVAVTPSGTLLLSSGFVVSAIQGTAPLAATPWPKFRCDAGNRASTARTSGPPTMVGLPKAEAARLGSRVVVGAVIAGQTPLTFEWYLNGQPLLDAPNCNYLVLTNLSSAQAGQYLLVASNALGRIEVPDLRVDVAYLLTRKVVGPGAIQLMPDLESYIDGTEVEIAALSTNREFLGWSGDLTGTNNPMKVVIGSDLTIMASFQCLPGDLKWKYPIINSYVSPALGFRDNVLVGTTEGVVSVNASTGQALWSFASNGSTTSPAVGHQGRVYVGLWDGRLLALDEATGAERWSFATQAEISTPPALGEDDTVFVGSLDRRLYALDGRTGSRLWDYSASNSITGSPVLGADRRLYFGDDQGVLYAVDTQNGSLKWTFSLGEAARLSAALSEGALFVRNTARTVVALAPETGTELWRATLRSSDGSELAIGASGLLYFGMADATAWALDQQTGRRSWELQLGGLIWSTPAVGADGLVWMGTDDGSLNGIDQTAGSQQWRHALGQPVKTSPAIGPDGVIYVVSESGALCAIQGTAPLAATPWPKFRSDNQNTGRISTGPSTNHAPTLTLIGSQTVPAGSLLTLTNAATDPDLPAQRLTFSLVSGPAGMTIDAVTGVLTWTPDASLANTTATGWVEVTDNGIPNLSVSRSFEVSVLPPAQPELRLTARAQGAGLQLVWDGAAGPQLVLERSPSLSAPIWTPVTEGIAEQDGQRVFSDPGQGQQAYYRLRVGP